jgi:hypothetical protein
MRHQTSRLPFAVLAVLSLTACSAGGGESALANRDSAGLRAAILAANADPGPNRIVLARRGLYTLAPAGDATSLLPPIEGELAIVGNGAELRGDSAQRIGLLEIAPGARVRLSDLTLAQGYAGALRNLGELELERVRIEDNTSDRSGAIVQNHGRLAMRDSSVEFNDVPARDEAGTVVNYGVLRLEHSRIGNNLVLRQRAGIATAGSVLNFGRVEWTESSTGGNRIEGEANGLAFADVLNLGSGSVSGDAPGEAVATVPGDTAIALGLGR